MINVPMSLNEVAVILIVLRGNGKKLSLEEQEIANNFEDKIMTLANKSVFSDPTNEELREKCRLAQLRSINAHRGKS